MKKLLTILGAITLIGTASTNIIACGDNSNPSTQKNDLNSLPTTTNVTIRSDSIDKVNDFKEVLINELKKQSGFSNLEISDVDITKSDGNTLTNNDIIQSTLNTKVKAKTSSQNFNGEKNINIIINIMKIKLSDVITNTNLGEINIPNSIITNVDNSKINTLIWSYLKFNNINFNLKTMGVKVDDVTIDKNIGFAKVKSDSKIKYYTGIIKVNFTVNFDKINLNKIDFENQNEIHANNSKKFKDLNLSSIFLLFKDIPLTKYDVSYFNDYNIEISDNIQTPMLIKIKIIIKNDDNQYFGEKTISSVKIF